MIEEYRSYIDRIYKEYDIFPCKMVDSHSDLFYASLIVENVMWVQSLLQMDRCYAGKSFLPIGKYYKSVVYSNIAKECKDASAVIFEEVANKCYALDKISRECCTEVSEISGTDMDDLELSMLLDGNNADYSEDSFYDTMFGCGRENPDSLYYKQMELDASREYVETGIDIDSIDWSKDNLDMRSDISVDLGKCKGMVSTDEMRNLEVNDTKEDTDEVYVEHGSYIEDIGYESNVEDSGGEVISEGYVEHGSYIEDIEYTFPSTESGNDLTIVEEEDEEIDYLDGNDLIIDEEDEEIDYVDSNDLTIVEEDMESVDEDYESFVNGILDEVQPHNGKEEPLNILNNIDDSIKGGDLSDKLQDISNMVLTNTRNTLRSIRKLSK